MPSQIAAMDATTFEFLVLANRSTYDVRNKTAESQPQPNHEQARPEPQKAKKRLDCKIKLHHGLAPLQPRFAPLAPLVAAGVGPVGLS